MSLLFSSAPVASAVTLQELQAQVAALMAQIAQLQGQDASATITTSLQSVRAFQIGDNVKVISKVNVRSSAGGVLVGQQFAGAVGDVVSGPVVASFGGISYTWWNVNFADGNAGWVVENYFVKTSGVTIPGIVVTPNNYNIPKVELYVNGVRNNTNISSGGYAIISWKYYNISSGCNLAVKGAGNLATSPSGTGVQGYNVYNITQNTTFVIGCDGGSVNDLVQVNVNSANQTGAPFVALEVNGSHGPVTITASAYANLSWKVMNLQNPTCSVTDYLGTFNNAGTNTTSVTGPITSDVTLSVKCTGQDSSGKSVTVSDSVNVVASQTGAVTVGLTVNGNSSTGYMQPQVDLGSVTQATINWTSSNAQNCSTYGQSTLKLSDGTFWNQRNLPSSGSRTFLLSGQVDGYGNPVSYENIGIQCWGNNQSQSASKGIIVTWLAQSSNAPTVTLTANPTTVNQGQPTTLTWSSTNATSCILLNSNDPLKYGNTTLWGTLTTYGTGLFTMTCTNSANQSSSANVTVTVLTQTQTTAPTVTLTASPSVITIGQSSLLNPVASDGNGLASCTLNGQNYSFGGPLSYVSPTQTTTYIFTCTNLLGKSASANTTVSVVVPPPTATMTLTSSATNITSGQSATLTWTSSSAVSCSNPSTVYVSSGDINGQIPSKVGGILVVTPSQTTTYGVTCSAGNGQYKLANVTINVVTPTPPPTTTVPDVLIENGTGTPSYVSVGNNTTGSWQISGGVNLITGTGSKNVTLRPYSGGTVYTFSYAQVSGYAYPPKVFNSVNPNSSSVLYLQPGVNANLQLTYTSSSSSNALSAMMQILWNLSEQLKNM